MHKIFVRLRVLLLSKKMWKMHPKFELSSALTNHWGRKEKEKENPNDWPKYSDFTLEGNNHFFWSKGKCTIVGRSGVMYMYVDNYMYSIFRSFVIQCTSDEKRSEKKNYGNDTTFDMFTHSRRRDYRQYKENYGLWIKSSTNYKFA